MRSKAIPAAICCFIAALFLLAYPIYVIRPFRFQGQRELAAALFVLQYRTLAGCGLAALALVIFGVARRPATGILAVLVIGCLALFRINIYEKMFHPLDQPTFAAVSKTRLAGDEQVIAVRIGKAARAYPIRGISYHHIVNDTLGGRALVATY